MLRPERNGRETGAQLAFRIRATGCARITVDNALSLSPMV